MRTHNGPRTTTAVRFPVELHRRLMDEANHRDVSVNFLVNRAVVRYLETLPPIEPEQQADT